MKKIFDKIFPLHTTETVKKDIKPGISLVGSIPFILLHLLCLGVIWTGISLYSVLFALFFYLIRMFGVTAFYHRYFSHKSFKTNRFIQFIFGFWGCTAVQRGPLWWAAIHRHHHIHADTEKDIHSPKFKGFWWSHIGWIMARENVHIRTEHIKDLMKYPELLLLERLSRIIPFLGAIIIFFIGMALEINVPEWNVTGLQLLVWGGFISTVFCSHCTFTINSFDHMFGSRRYNTPDTSRNNVVTAILTLGEGWHNNHHHYPTTTKAGFEWWQIDITYYILLLFSWLRIIKDLTPLPEEIRLKNRI